MRVYSFNRGIGWASSGVEYAQAYRNEIFRKIGVQAKFVFTDMFRVENLEHYTANLGFSDDQVVWLYGAFTDVPVAPCGVPFEELEASFTEPFRKVVGSSRIQYLFQRTNSYVNAYYCSQNHRFVQRAEHVERGYLVRTDYYTCTRIFSEFWAPKEGRAFLYLRRFYNMDGGTAFEEFLGDGAGVAEGDSRILNGSGSLFRFPDHLVEGKDQLVRLLMDRLALEKGDLVLIDRSTDLGRGVLDGHGDAQLATVIHAEHYNPQGTDSRRILWNNFYEYTFAQAGEGMWYIASTEKQKDLLQKQMQQYKKVSPRIYAIPVGSLTQLRRPDGPRKTHSLITASRLAGEKHIDWIVRGVAKARTAIPDLTLDIYGKGGEEQKLKDLIDELGAGGYIRLMGHQNLTNMYTGYEAYISASTSEGFGLTLMEAVGSGLGMIGFNVRYGNITFIRDGKNGVLLPYGAEDDLHSCTEKLSGGIRHLFLDMDINSVRENSYALAEPFLEDHVVEQWKQLLHDAETTDQQEV